MHTIQITSEYAFPALVDKLGQWKITTTAVNQNEKTLTCAFETKDATEVTNTLVNLLFQDWLFEHLQQQMMDRQTDLEPDELEYFLLVLTHELKSGIRLIRGQDFETWQEMARKSLTSLLSSQSQISLDGFARFRLRKWIQGLDTILAERHEQFLLDREYEDSVEMLRFMLEAQPASQMEVHVFSAPDRVWLTDASGTLIRDSEVTEAALSESTGELDSEDLAMSILITRSPCKIILHDLYPDAPWPSFAETLGKVFRDRVLTCGRCTTCKQLEQANHYFPSDPMNLPRFWGNH